LLLLAIALVIAADKTYYELLEVPIDASATDIKKAYRRLSLLHHPDYPDRGNEKEAQMIFRDISEAYEVLSEDNSRASYNRSLKRPQSRSTRTVTENGQRVTIQSLEKDGNKIEEKYLGERLISRHINGQPDQQIGAGEEL
jgi:curved DNA-binding protein CbpA